MKQNFYEQFFWFLPLFCTFITSMTQDFNVQKHIFLPNSIKNSINYINSMEESDNNDLRLNANITNQMSYETLLDLINKTLDKLKKNEKRITPKHFYLLNNLLTGYYNLITSETAIKSSNDRIIIFD